MTQKEGLNTEYTRSVGLEKRPRTGALNVQLTPADLSELETAFSQVKVHGGRMNEMQMRIVDQTA